ncbi:hypothetical protein BU251_02670 [Candidatus Velamenicoccus archaeovorus]|uniref:Uncharacterized protein n=1 Tax=Velamenicoccus archaeovorus TaxID=1930593 RepID=A0A410P3P4_VELA1|nr:hypothetical protein [Candidatus Velamenicoccus archaeovorus]QAT16711.1 hypothetical protein BU251_02670 [Candidatus Velamenicoccus archaeovorus]
MIDEKLIHNARPASKIVESIDESWRQFVEDLKEQTFKIPFKGNYRCCVKDGFFHVEAYVGLLVIDKLYDGHNTYLLKTPIKHEPFTLYGEYDQTGDFRDFVSDPEIGCHYLAMSDMDAGRKICTGDIQINNASLNSLEALKAMALEVIKSFRLINLTSLGTVILPEEHSALRDVLSDKSKDTDTKTKSLLDAGLIEPLLT